MSEVAERLAANVVTSENLAEFNAKRMGLADPLPQDAAAVEENPAEPSEDVAQSDPSGEDEAKATEERKPNPKLERRFSQITKERESARDEARRERELRESLEVQVRELKNKAQPSAEPKFDSEPKPEQFTDMYEYQQALVDYRVDQRLGEEKQKEANARAEAERVKVINTWAKRVETAKAEIPDFEDMVGSADVAVSNEVRDAIFESDVGPRVLYHLAENPDIAEKLNGMTMTAALRMIGKLEAQFEKKSDEQLLKTVVNKSKAPAPINPIRSAANGRDVNLTSDGQFHGSYQAWKAARLAGRIR
jgi:hypothetical protein